MHAILARPEVALFLALALGHLVGKLRIGPIQIGGICGTLIVALVIGQVGVKLSADLKNVAFALFIFALGFTAGPQFFANIKTGWRLSIFPFIEAATVVALVLLTVVVLHFDPGTAAGLLAGSATESAVVGTASEALGRLGHTPEMVKTLQGNIATAYSITYLFGLVAIVVFATMIAPRLLGIDLRKEAEALARKMGEEDDAGQSLGLPAFVGRAFHAGPAAGTTVGALEREAGYAMVIERVWRGGALVETTPETALGKDDVVLAIGRRTAVVAARAKLGDEVPLPADVNVRIISQDILLTSALLTRAHEVGPTLAALRGLAATGVGRGVFITRIHRMQHEIPVLPETVLQRGDVVTLIGTKAALDRTSADLGPPLVATEATDFVFLGLGVLVGILIGSLSLKFGALDLALGTGGGALLSGLVFGWLRLRHPRIGSLPPAAAEVLKDFGISTFIAAIGLSTGPDAIHLIKQYGLVLPVLGILVSAGPAFVSLMIGKYFLKIEPPILLGAIAGQHCSTPTLSSLVSMAGNSTPVIGYSVTYAIGNVILPLLGPVVVLLAAALGG
jgi:aspartate-alanine antiporter